MVVNDGILITWLVVYLLLWKIWVRQLGSLSPMYGKIKMFQTTNQFSILLSNFKQLIQDKPGRSAPLWSCLGELWSARKRPWHNVLVTPQEKGKTHSINTCQQSGKNSQIIVIIQINDVCSRIISIWFYICL